MTDSAHADSSSPVSPLDRRSPLTMALIWITMVTAFPSVLIGFEWHKQQLTITQVALCSGISCLILLAYSIPTCHLASRTGLGYCALSRNVFGHWGSRLISFNLIWMFLLFYGVMALLLAEEVVNLLPIKVSVPILSVIIALLMAANNLFGFKGVANFARFVAAPVLIIWVAFTFGKAAMFCPSAVIHAVPQKSFMEALTIASSFIIGFAVWGNEADYWRYSKPKKRFALASLAVALLVGEVLFPLAGWMIAHVSGITDNGAATAFMNKFSFGTIVWAAPLILGVMYFASNDSNLFGSISAIQSLFKVKHKIAVAIMAILGSITAVLLHKIGGAGALESIAAINCVVLPMPTIVVLTEWWFAKRACENRLAGHTEVPRLRWAACTALLAGYGLGIATSGVIPGTTAWHVGIFSVQAWLACALCYVPLRFMEEHLLTRKRSLALEALRHLDFTIGSPISEVISERF